MKDGDKNNDGRIDFDGEGLGSARSGRPNQAGESERGAHAGVPSLEGGAGRGQAPPHPLRAGRGDLREVLCTLSTNDKAPPLRGRSLARPASPLGDP